MLCKKSALKNFVKLTVETPCRTRTQVLFCQCWKTFNNTFFTEHLRWLFFPILKPLDSQRQWWKWISELLTILFISGYLVLVGVFAFIFGKHKRSVASRRLIILFWLRRIEISWYLNQPISFCANSCRNNHRITSILLSSGPIGLMKVEICRRCVT